MVYFLYAEQYLTDRSAWEKLVSQICPSAELPYQGEDFLHHAGMYELARRYGLAGLERSA